MSGIDILTMVLVIISIVAVIFLIFVLWRLYRILANVDEMVVDLKSAVGKVTVFVNNTVQKLSELSANLDIFVKIAEKVTDLIKSYIEKRNKK